VAVISLNDIAESTSVRVGGNKMDEAIANYIKRKYNLMVGERTAEELKIRIGSALPLEEELEMEVRGRDQVAGLPRTITVRTNEVVEAISEPLEAIVGAVRTVLERTPPELASDIIDRGMVMTGGGSLLRHIDELMTQVTGIPCYVADNPLQCVALGTGIALDRLEVLRDSLKEE
jgi:rod shape-determining protein MreB